MAVSVLSNAFGASWLPQDAPEFVLGEALQTSNTVAAGGCLFFKAHHRLLAWPLCLGD